MKKIIITILLILTGNILFAGTLETVYKQNILRVGTTEDYIPFTYIEKEENKGYDIEVAKLVAKELGVEIEFVPTTWKNLTQDLNSKKFDIAMGGITRTVARQKMVEQTKPYLIFGKSFLINKANADRFKSLDDLNKKGVRIGVNLGGTNESFAKEVIKNADIVYFEKNLDVPVAVANGSIDAMVSENIEVIAYEKKDPIYVGLYTHEPLTKNQFGYLIQKGDLEMLNMVNFILEELELKGTLKELRKKYKLED